MPTVKALQEIFFILDLEKAAKGGRVGYYLEDSHSGWDFFGIERECTRENKKYSLLQKKLIVFINYYLPEITTDRLYIPLTEEVLDIDLKDEPSHF